MSQPFSILPLREELLQALEQIGYAQMTPIQAQALPTVIRGADVIGRARTGSGKTAVFGLGLLQALDPSDSSVQALVICPTRELAEQVASELRRLASRMPGTRILPLCGGRSSGLQRQSLQGGCQVVVGTPGRLGALIERGDLELSSLKVLVLDEADRMLDMGFIDEVQVLVEACPRQRQTLLFSATMPEPIAALSQQIQDKPRSVSVAAEVAPDSLQQLKFSCERVDREQRVLDLLAHYAPEQALVFCETRQDCESMTDYLRHAGLSAEALHGGMEQMERDDAWLQFVHGSSRVLVATNVAARGLDLPALPMVIVAELGGEPQAHLHRIGRTGRAGEAGLALTLVASQAERGRLERIEEFLGENLAEGPEVPPCPPEAVFPRPAFRTLLLLSGRKDKLRKGDVLGALIKDAGLPAEAIGRIDLMDTRCGVAIATEHAGRALGYLKTGRIKKLKVRGLLLGG
jgi:ATP-independent RNA helicase DbpA